MPNADHPLRTYPSSSTSHLLSPGFPPQGDPPPRGWDYVLVFPDPAAKALSASGHSIADSGLEATLSRLVSVGFVYNIIEDTVDHQLFLRLALPDHVLLEKAEAAQIKLELLPLYGGGFLPFTSDRADKFVNSLRAQQGLPYFHTAEIVLLALRTFASRQNWGAALDIEHMVHSGALLQAYALHRPNERQLILNATSKIPLHELLHEGTLTQMKHYLGAQATLYVAFLSFYSRFIRGIALLSAPVTFLLYVGSASPLLVAATRCLFGLAVVFWATYFVEYWKRRNAVLNVKWGLTDVPTVESHEVRPQYVGEFRSGFWSSGGFVDLRDLDAADIGRESQREVSSTAVADSTPVSDSALDLSPDSSRRVLIGGAKDDLFKIETLYTGATFSDLPEFPVCSPKEVRRRQMWGAAVTFLFAVIVWCFTFIILYYQHEMIEALSQYSSLASFAPFLPGVATGVLISISDAIWRTVSSSLVCLFRRLSLSTFSFFLTSVMHAREMPPLWWSVIILTYYSLFRLTGFRAWPPNYFSFDLAPVCIV